MKFVLILMIKNEEKILKRCLEAVENIADAFCICDTGSTDKSHEVANEFLKTHTGNLTMEPWQNFGHNRSVSFVNAQTYVKNLGWNLEETYGLLLDADMVFVAGRLKTYPLTAKGYKIVQKNNNLEYYNARVIRMDHPWKCVGVTHEYWDGPCDNLERDVCFIDDRNDGGCKHDKFERDAKLLQQGLIDEPQNVRYMFYLAQTYKCLGRYEDAVRMYKQRMRAGGWDEEIWNAHYSIGDCYLSLKNLPKFEEWMQKAFIYRPCRVESIYQLARVFREMGHHYKSYQYIKIGENVPYPKNDVLFIENKVYQGLFDYEASIVEYYVHPEKCLRTTIAYMLQLPDYQDNCVSNLKFSVKPLNGKIQKLKLPSPFGDHFTPSAISILDYPMANVRYINYKIQPDGSYVMPDGIVVTKNAYVNLDTLSYSCMEEPEVKYDTHIKGLEDLRLYKFNGKMMFSATSFKQYIQDKVSIVHGEYDIQTNSYKNYIGIQSPTNSDCEKNWVNIPGTDEFIYSWHPFRTGKIRNDKFYFNRVENTPPLFSLFRGSASPIEVNGKWLILVHFVEYCQPRKYYHCFVQLEKETYKILGVSLPFVFQKIGIEYCISGRYNNDSLEFYFSSWDKDPSKIILDIASISWISIQRDEPVPEKSNIVRVPSTLKAYWDGGYSRCLAGGHIENYVNRSINKQKLNLTAIFSSSDGVLSNTEYKRQYDSVGRDIANISESDYYKLCKPTSIIPVLCSRDFTPNNMLLLPLDDDTFNNGLRLPIVDWKNKRSKVFWRGGSSGYDRPSIRMDVTKLLYTNKNSDVRMTKWGNWENEKDIPEEHFGDRCPIEKHLNYKYILIVDGNCIASNHQWVFASGSVPVMITHPENNYWFKKFLKPMENYVPINYDLSDLEEKIQWLVDNDAEAQKIAENSLKFSREVFSPEFQRSYIDIEIKRLSSLEIPCIMNGNMDWIEQVVSAWTGHRKFAEWIVTQYSNPTVVELGVDYGYSTFVFANALKGTTGTIYGIDLFAGDVHAGYRNTYEGVLKNIKDHDVTNIEIIMGDFTHVSKLWNKPINILHIDGLHTYEAVKNDFTNWSKFVDDNGIVLFHDTAIQHFGIKDFFRELSGGHRLYFTHSAGLGIYTKNEQLYKLILSTFDNVYDFNTKPF